MIDDEDTPARAGTPRPSPVKNEEGAAGDLAAEKSKSEDGMQTSEKSAAPEEQAQTPELPTDVRVKLRKLERLEARYQGLFTFNLNQVVELTG